MASKVFPKYGSTMSLNSFAPAVHKKPDHDLDYHCSIIYNGPSSSSRANSSSSRHGTVSSRASRKKGVLNATHFSNYEICCNGPSGRMFLADSSGQLRHAGSFMSLQNERHDRTAPCHHHHQHDTAYVPLTTSNLRKLNYLNRTIYLPSSSAAAAANRSVNSRDLFNTFQRQSRGTSEVNLDSRDYLKLPCNYYEDNAATDHYQINEDETNIVFQDEDNLDNTLSDVDTMIETTFENENENEEEAPDEGVRRAYVPFKSKSEPATADQTSIQTEINFRSKPASAEPKGEEEPDTSAVEDDMKIDLKDLAAIARARAAKPKKSEGQMVKAF